MSSIKKQGIVSGISLTGSGIIMPRIEDELPIIVANEISDCEFSGELIISGSNTDYLLIHNAKIGNVDLKIQGSYKKIAFVNCTFIQQSLVIIDEEGDTKDREILLMGCEYPSKECEVFLTEDTKDNLNWKTENLWVYDHIVTLDELPGIRSYLDGKSDDRFDFDYDMYGVSLEEKSELEKKYEDNSDSGWKLPLATLGIAAIFGIASSKTKKNEVKNNARTNKAKEEHHKSR